MNPAGVTNISKEDFTKVKSSFLFMLQEAMASQRSLSKQKAAHIILLDSVQISIFQRLLLREINFVSWHDMIVLRHDTVISWLDTTISWHDTTI